MNIFDTHPWLGTQHCLREKQDDEYQCCNDHTGCWFNDGHNTCMIDIESNKQYDSPLLCKTRPKRLNLYMTSPHRVYSSINGQED